MRPRWKSWTPLLFCCALLLACQTAPPSDCNQVHRLTISARNGTVTVSPSSIEAGPGDCVMVTLARSTMLEELRFPRETASRPQPLLDLSSCRTEPGRWCSVEATLDEGPNAMAAAVRDAAGTISTVNWEILPPVPCPFPRCQIRIFFRPADVSRTTTH